jgi:HlyD family secretion protein
MRKWIKRTAAGAVVLAAIGTAFAWYFQQGDGKGMSFKTAQVTRGDLLVTIDATGTLEPEEVVDVGAQVAGQILTFGTDADGKTVDYGSRVEQGTVLANIDEALPQADVKQAEAQVKSAQAGVELAEARVTSLKTRVSQAQAQLSSAQAGVRRAEADVEQLKAKFSQAQRDWERAQKLGPSEALAQATYDGYQFAYEAARANVAVGEACVLQARADGEAARSALAMAQADVAEGEASLAQAKAGLAQAETSLWRAKRNLGYCTIASPVKGVVIDRRVNIGQTVVASLNAPSLFLIAKDLSRMQVWVAVNEADVAKIYPGQPVTFAVDALPDETFRGEVVKVRLNASMTQNVVTYTVEIVTDNSAGRLLPYLTANVKFEVNRRQNVLLVPSAALRWTASVAQVAPEFRNGPPEDSGQPTSPPQEPSAGTGPNESNAQRFGVVYAVAGQYVRPVPVKVGLSSGSYTEVAGEGLAEGMEMEVVMGMEAATAATAETSNPFTPKLPRPPKGGPPPP